VTPDAGQASDLEAPERVRRSTEGKEMAVRLLLVDDHQLVRSGLRAVLAAEPDFDIVAEAGTGARALCLARRLRPDVVLTDLLLPDLDGVALTQRIRAELPDVQVVVLSSVSDQDDWMVRVIRAGALSYVVKTADIAELIQTIRQAAAGESRLSPRVVTRLMQEMQAPHEARLTGRERDVVREIALGRTDKEIARAFALSLSTVKTHVRSILDKLGASSRTEAVVRVLQSNLCSFDELESREYAAPPRELTATGKRSASDAYRASSSGMSYSPIPMRLRRSPDQSVFEGFD
jgi:two-component system, NarL family, response regulator LiaR